MKRPTAVTVFGILNIIFAAFGILGSLSSVMLFTVAAANTPNSANNPIVQLVHEISIVLGMLGSVALLAAGIGLLQLKPWARKFSIGYAIYAMIMIVVGSVLNYFWLVLPMLQKAHLEQGPQAAAAVGGAIGATVGGCFGIIYPILLLIFMFRANVIAAFNPAQPTEPPQPPPIPGQS
jgi:hypothetical protein